MDKSKWISRFLTLATKKLLKGNENVKKAKIQLKKFVKMW